MLANKHVERRTKGRLESPNPGNLNGIKNQSEVFLLFHFLNSAKVTQVAVALTR